ncbi:MAG: guanylate kinase [Patescibacteria group bacterium]|jgi:guanylate kinase
MKHQERTPGILFLLVGPSRVGKDSILKALLNRRSLRLKKLVTMTTRPRRPREVNGKTYHYVSDATFLQKDKTGGLLEWAPVRHYRFGTPREPLMTWLRNGQQVLQQVDVRGAAALRRIPGLNTVTVFILPGSVGELRQRLNKKGFTPAERRIRWQETLEELQRQTEFDYRVVNAQGKLNQAVDEVAVIIRASLKAPSRHMADSAR